MLERLEENIEFPNEFQPTLVAVLISVFIVLWIQMPNLGFRFKLNKLCPPNRIPGPGVLQTLKLLNPKNLMPLLNKWAKSYGDIFEIKIITCPIVFLNSPAFAQKLLGSKDSSHLSKPLFYDPLKPFLGDGILLSVGEKWKHRRKLLTAYMFSYKTFSRSAKLFNEEANNLVKVLESSEFANDVPKPIEDLLLKATMGPIAKMVFGRQPSSGVLKKKHEERGLEIARKAKEVFKAKALNPFFQVSTLWRLHPLHKTEQEVLSFIKQIGLELEHSEFVFKEELQAAGVSLDGIFEEAWTLLVAGYETTANALHFLLFLLALNQSQQELCQQEVDKIFEEFDLSANNYFIPLEALKRLTYLEMCLKESLRLIPIAPFFVRKITTPLDLGNNLIIPSNTNVGIFVNGIHKNPEIYPEPEQFIPERFSKENHNKRDSYSFLPFSAGPRMCIGQKFATMQIFTFAARILRNFCISTTTKLEDVVLVPHVTTEPETPMKFIFEKRK